MNRGLLRCLFVLVLAAGSVNATADIRVSDDSGREVLLARPATRIISLAPHIVELLFAAGAGDRIVGTVEYSTFPEAAKSIPRIGDSAQLDLERIISLKPDLIVVWQHGNAQRQLDRLLRLGIPVYYNEPRSLSDIAKSVEQFGILTGNEAHALPAAREFQKRESALRARYEGRSPVKVFYQIWEKPLMTVNGEHIISDMMRLCGGKNVFAQLKQLVPVVSTEAVLVADPEAIGGATAEVNTIGKLDNWKKWPRLLAVARDNLFVIHSDLISRHTPRMLDGAQQMCESIELARARRPKDAR
jgi:iron complex transport system substrate-binding protein